MPVAARMPSHGWRYWRLEIDRLKEPFFSTFWALWKRDPNSKIGCWWPPTIIGNQGRYVGHGLNQLFVFCIRFFHWKIPASCPLDVLAPQSTACQKWRKTLATSPRLARSAARAWRARYLRDTDDRMLLLQKCGEHQVRLVVYPIIYWVSSIPGGLFGIIFHQQ